MYPSQVSEGILQYYYNLYAIYPKSCIFFFKFDRLVPYLHFCEKENLYAKRYAWQWDTKQIRASPCKSNSFGERNRYPNYYMM